MGKRKKRSPNDDDEDDEDERGEGEEEKGGEETKEATALTSLFATSNPFRRKPQSSPNNSPSGSHHHIPLVNKKKLRKTDLSISPPIEEQLEVEEKDDDNNNNDKKKKKKRKRKRDEIEFEYERRRYGSSTAEEEEEEEEEEEDGHNEEARASAVAVVGQKRKKAEKEKDEGGFDDEGKLLRTVFVGNLPVGTKRKALLKEFSSAFGEVESVRIRSVPIAPNTKAPRKAAVIKGKVNDAIGSVHAYIVFKDEQSARAALAHNMAKFGGNHIRVDMACPPRKKMKGEAPMYSVKKTVFVGNLPFDVKDEELYQLFCEEHQMESSVEAVRVIRDPQTSLGKGFAYVMFKTREAANTVVKRKGIKLRDRELRISHARTDSTPSKRKMENHRAVGYPSKRMPNSSRQADGKPNVMASSLSYQGLRSSKSGRPKKAPRVNRLGSTGSGGSKQSEGKVRKQKRPAVAARKANAQKQGQKKRKMESPTPENPHRRKKARHFS